MTINREATVRNTAIATLGMAVVIAPDIPSAVVGSLLTAVRTIHPKLSAISEVAMKEMLGHLTEAIRVGSGNPDEVPATQDEYFAALRTVAGSDDASDAVAKGLRDDPQTAVRENNYASSQEPKAFAKMGNA